MYYTYVCCLCAQCALVLMCVWLERELAMIQRNHHTVRMLSLSVVVHCISLVFFLVHYSRYKDDGVGSNWCLVTGRVIFHLAELLMVLLFICLAKVRPRPASHSVPLRPTQRGSSAQ